MSTGVFGAIILALFFSTIITVDRVVFVMPLFIAFNGAMTGYRLVEQHKIRINNITAVSMLTGAGVGAVTFFVIFPAVYYAGNPFLLSLFDLFIYMAVSGITGYLGAMLAIRYFNL